MEIYQIILIVVVISILLGLILYISQEIENSNYRANWAKTHNCTYNEKGECIDAIGKAT